MSAARAAAWSTVEIAVDAHIEGRDADAAAIMSQSVGDVWWADFAEVWAVIATGRLLRADFDRTYASGSMRIDAATPIAAEARPMTAD